MTDVASRELRNNTRGLLDRVAAGEEITITVDGRPAARLVPVDPRPGSWSRAEFLRDVVPRRADSALRDDLREMLGDETTDDLPWR